MMAQPTIEPVRFPVLQVVADSINVFADYGAPRIFEGVQDAERVVFVSIGAGETRINVIDGEGASLRSWTAVTGWSALCSFPVEHGGERIFMDTPDQIGKALKGKLRMYGAKVECSDFSERSARHMRSSLGMVLDKTIGDARDYDRIVYAAPDWLHPALQSSLDLRPHIDKTIQDL